MIDAKEELRRVLPVVTELRKRFPNVPISIDTVRSEVARECLEVGAAIVNDISAGSIDATLWEVVAKYKAPYLLMHMQGRPSTMQQAPTYENVVVDVLDFLIEKVGQLRQLGVKDIVIDPGFGFGKSIDHNYQLLKHLHAFQILDCPILAGVSRKSMIYKLLKISPEEALPATSALHLFALQEGARLLRVHDVKEAKQVIQLWQTINAQPNI